MKRDNYCREGLRGDRSSQAPKIEAAIFASPATAAAGEVAGRAFLLSEHQLCTVDSARGQGGGKWEKKDTAKLVEEDTGDVTTERRNSQIVIINRLNCNYQLIETPYSSEIRFLSPTKSQNLERRGHLFRLPININAEICFVWRMPDLTGLFLR